MENESDELGVLGREIDGRYRLDRFVGAGTMGAVYEGTQLAVGRRVAIKLLNAALQTHQEVRDRFRVEAQAIATLSHPNCVTLYDFGYAEDLSALYMAVEFLDGHSLQELIHRGLEPRAALLLSRQIADVLALAHAAGIMHRDLKPENVMVVEGADGIQAKVLDFGLARIFEDATGGARLTRQGQLFGTPAYMSPEQCRSAMDVGPPSDIYSLGVSMFEMLMGHLPFESPSVPELLILHSTKTAPPVATNADTPIEVSAMIARMMAKNPEDRPTANDISAVLSAVLEGQAPPVLPPPASVSGEREIQQVQATLAMTHSNDDVTSTGMLVDDQPGRPPTVAIVALAIAAIFLVGTLGLAMTGDEPADAQLPPVSTPVATSVAPPTEAAVEEADVAPEQAVSDGRLAAAALSSAARKVAAEAGKPAEQDAETNGEAPVADAATAKGRWKQVIDARRARREARKTEPKTRKKRGGKTIEVPVKPRKRAKKSEEGFEELTGEHMY